MCGIAGFLGRGTQETRRAIVQGMAASLRHRGPDDEGIYVDGDAALGVRRLSIIDLETGAQPISNEDGTIWAALNGEIYNFKHLRARLERLGHTFRTRSDTEVLVHAYEQYGDDCVSHLDGMFAFAVWDAVRHELCLARDRMGEKPLYYYAGPGAFVFGSEPRALLEHPEVPRALSLTGLAAYLAFEYVPTPHAIFEGMAKLPPGHTLTVSPGDKIRLVQYWDLSFAPDFSVDASEWEERLLAQLERSVRRRLMSDVPLGMFLSGGIDSSAIVALATRASGRRPLKTFALGFDDPSYDERPFARLVAEHCGTDHEEMIFTAGDAAQLVDRVGELLDEPLVDGSFLPTYALSRFARGSVKVVLSGDGGDELFCGYPTFLADRAARWVERLPKCLQTAASDAVNRLPISPRYGSLEFLLKQFFRGLPHPPEVRTQLLLGGLTATERRRLFSREVGATWRRDEPSEEPLAALAEIPGLGPVERLIYQHCKFYLAGQNLVTVDRASMAAGLEVRAPFLDHALVELAGRIPSTLKVRGWRMKHVLKRAVRHYLPHTIVNRRKQGFGVPIAPWLRGPLRATLTEALEPDRVARVGLFDPTTVAQLLAEHLAGRRNHQKILWALLVFDRWRDRYLPGQRWS